MSESYGPELPASVGNVSEITVAGADGCKHSGRWRATEACAAKGVQYGGKILAASRHTELFCGVQSLLQSWEFASRDNIVRHSRLMLLFLLLLLNVLE